MFAQMSMNVLDQPGCPVVRALRSSGAREVNMHSVLHLKNTLLPQWGRRMPPYAMQLWIDRIERVRERLWFCKNTAMHLMSKQALHHPLFYGCVERSTTRSSSRLLPTKSQPVDGDPEQLQSPIPFSFVHCLLGELYSPYTQHVRILTRPGRGVPPIYHSGRARVSLAASTCSHKGACCRQAMWR